MTGSDDKSAIVLAANACGAYPGAPGANDSDLFGYWRMLSRHWVLLLFCALFGGLTMAAYSLIQTPTYEAGASLEFTAPGDAPLKLKEFENSAVSAPMSMDSYVQTQAEILRDETIIAPVVARLDLAKRPEFRPRRSRIEAIRSILGLPVRTSGAASEQVMLIAISHLSVRPVEQTRLIRISFVSTDPKLAADFVNALAAEFIERDLAAKEKSAEMFKDWLRGQLVELKGRLESSERELQSYATNKDLLFTQDKDSVGEVRLHKLEQELTQAHVDRVARQAQAEVASVTNPESLSQALTDSSFRDYESKLTELRRESAELTTLLTPSNYKVQRVQAQIAELEAGERKDLENLRKRIGSDLAVARTREAELAADYEQQSKLVAVQSASSIHYNTLKREVETARDLHTEMSHEYQMAAVESALQATNIRIVGAAQPASRPFKPNLPLASSAGTFCGLILGVVVISFREQKDRRIKSGEFSGLPDVQQMGAVLSARYLKPDGTRRRLGVLSGVRPADGLELVTWNHNSSIIAESFREALTSLLFTIRRDGTLRVLVFTSPGPAEGKTTLVSNFAVILAETGQRVLLVDGDLRRPSLHSVFHRSNEAGLTSLLTDDNPLDPAGLEKLIQSTYIPGLSLLTAGPDVSNVASLLHGRLVNLISIARGGFDVVLIDSPPVLLLPDSRLLARAADGVVLVLRAHQTTREAAQEVVQRFMVDRIPIVGSIMNDCDSIHNTSFYHSRYKIRLPATEAARR
jgi:succinoglycan biosynthesis transport protein ExoP